MVSGSLRTVRGRWPSWRVGSSDLILEWMFIGCKLDTASFREMDDLEGSGIGNGGWRLKSMLFHFLICELF